MSRLQEKRRRRDAALRKRRSTKFIRAGALTRMWNIDRSTITRLRQRGILVGYKTSAASRMWFYDARQAMHALRAYYPGIVPVLESEKPVIIPAPYRLSLGRRPAS